MQWVFVAIRYSSNNNNQCIHMYRYMCTSHNIAKLCPHHIALISNPSTLGTKVQLSLKKKNYCVAGISIGDNFHYKCQNASGTNCCCAYCHCTMSTIVQLATASCALYKTILFIFILNCQLTKNDELFPPTKISHYTLSGGG